MSVIPFSSSMDGYNGEDKYRLLDQSSDLGHNLENEELESPSNWWRENILALAIVILLFYIAVLETVGISTRSTCHMPKNSALKDDQPNLIPPGLLRYEQREEWVPFQHPWNIEPSPELDAVWEDLLFARNVRVTHDEMLYLQENLTDLIQVDHHDYPAVMGIFHHLHCLNNLRKIVHWEYYGPLMEGEDESLSKGHSDHCIDAIRQSLMCHSNTALYTAEWLNDTKHPINKELKSNKQATCVDWGSLDTWARQRALVPGTYHYLPGPYPPNTFLSEG